MGFLSEASRGTSPIPDLVSAAGNPDSVTTVLDLVREQPEFAEDLARALLAAVSNEDLGKAIADTKKAYDVANSDGSAEALIIAEIESLIGNTIGNADLAVGFIVKTFEEEAAAATNVEELEAAFNKGGSDVVSQLDSLQTSMTRAVTAMAPSYDLEFAY
jgi:hypothetical protein